MVDEVRPESSASPPTAARPIVSVVIGGIAVLVGLLTVFDHAFNGQPSWPGVCLGLGSMFFGVGLVVGSERLWRWLVYGFAVALLACSAVSLLLRHLG
jgi:hypothetical protein